MNATLAIGCRFYMKTALLISVLVSALAASSCGQGLLVFSNRGAPTRTGSTNGPFADSTIWAQLWVGETLGSLAPVGTAVQHLSNGGVFGGVIAVPNVDGGRTAYVQMLAWNGDLWGSALGNVPLDQRGETDIVPIFLTFPFDPQSAPRFTQGAIVPIPEPATWVLGLVGALALLPLLRRRRP